MLLTDNAGRQNINLFDDSEVWKVEKSRYIFEKTYNLAMTQMVPTQRELFVWNCRSFIDLKQVFLYNNYLH